MPPKPTPEHRDKLGRLLKVGDFVAFPDSNSLEVGMVKKLNPKMVGVSRIKSKWTQNKYPEDIVCLEGPEVTIYLLKNNG
jgi:hypothetical protein